MRYNRLPRTGREGSPVASYVVFTRLTARGKKALRRDPDRLALVNREVERQGARVTRQFQTLGEYDFVTFVEAPDNETVSSVAAAISALGSLRLNVYPSIKLDRFMQLLQQKSYRTEPHEWQTQLWAQALRRAGRHWVVSRHVQQFCRPLTVTGREHVAGMKGPALVVANHTSHFDTPVVLTSLPESLRRRTAVAAAADRFYRTTKRSWWYSLFLNSYPIARGGGMAALDYSLSLLGRGWSILIYPEGGRFKPGEVQRFRHGPTILALQAKVPVIPVYLEGLHNIMPKGTREPQPAAASARIGPPVRLDGVASIPEGTAMLQKALRSLAGPGDVAAAAAG